MVDFISMIKRGAPGGRKMDGRQQPMPIIGQTQMPDTQGTPIMAQPSTTLPKYERKIDLPTDMKPIGDTGLGPNFDVHLSRTSAKQPAAWKEPLSNAFGAISDLTRAQESEDFLPPPEMQGVIPRPQSIPYQPIPYQAPILRRY
jgi:hypothetical protein